MEYKDLKQGAILERADRTNQYLYLVAEVDQEFVDLEMYAPNGHWLSGGLYEAEDWDPSEYQYPDPANYPKWESFINTLKQEFPKMELHWQ